MAQQRTFNGAKRKKKTIAKIRIASAFERYADVRIFQIHNFEWASALCTQCDCVCEWAACMLLAISFDYSSLACNGYTDLHCCCCCWCFYCISFSSPPSLTSHSRSAFLVFLGVLFILRSIFNLGSIRQASCRLMCIAYIWDAFVCHLLSLFLSAQRATSRRTTTRTHKTLHLFWLSNSYTHSCRTEATVEQ